jgi:acyl-CoA thioesterase
MKVGAPIDAAGSADKMHTISAGTFGRATSTRLLEDGVYGATLDEAWWGPIGPHGGYLAAITLRAMAGAVDGMGRRPVSLSVDFLQPARPGPVEISVHNLRPGRNHDAVEGRLISEGALIATASALFGSPRSPLSYEPRQAPAMPSPRECQWWDGGGWDSPVLAQYQARVPESPPNGEGMPVSNAAWLRLVGDWELDWFSLTFLADAWVPPIFGVLPRPVRAAPTLSMSFWYSGRGAATDSDTFVMGCFRAEQACDGYVIEDGELWSEAGDLLLRCRQVAVVVE